MAWFRRNCSYTESHAPEHTYTFTGKCVITGEDHSVTVKGPDLYKYNQGAYIQDAFPYLSAADREFLMTGTSPKGWDEMWGFDDDEDDDEESRSEDIEINAGW
jgi:hypothetical protein